MIKTFIIDSNFSFDLGNIYKYILLNKDSIDSKLTGRAFLQLYGYHSKSDEPKFPFYPKNWKFVKEISEEYQSNEKNSIPNKYFLRQTSFDESQLSDSERNLLLASTSVIKEEGVTEFDFDVWRKYQYDIFSLEEETIIAWENSEFQNYWLSWYLTLMDKSLFNQELVNNLCSLTGFSLDELRQYLINIHIKNLDIFLLSDWDEKKTRFFSLNHSAKNHKNEAIEGKSITVQKTASRKKGDLLTVLTAVQTNLFFRYLQEAEVIIKDKSIQSDLNFAKLISCLSGFNLDTLRNADKNIKKEDRREIAKILEKIKILIERDLK